MNFLCEGLLQFWLDEHYNQNNSLQVVSNSGEKITEPVKYRYMGCVRLRGNDTVSLQAALKI